MADFLSPPARGHVTRPIESNTAQSVRYRVRAAREAEILLNHGAPQLIAAETRMQRVFRRPTVWCAFRTPAVVWTGVHSLAGGYWTDEYVRLILLRDLT
jgi:hypothetical protein